MSVPERHPIAFLGLGDSLAEARLARGLDLRDVERDTRIRARYLSALEQESFDALPGDAYARVFLRSYAAYLGLDPDVYAEEYRRRRGAQEEPVVPAPSAGGRPRRPLLVLASAGLVAAVAASLAVVLGLRGGEQPAPAPAEAAPAAPAPEPAATSVAVTAVRGDTRMTVRFQGPRGAKVWEGTLKRGRTMRLGLGRQLWIRIEAPENVEVRLGEETLAARPELRLGG